MDYQLGPGPLQVDQNTIDEKIKGDIGIVENGDVATHAITKGYYVIWKGDLYVAKTDISSGTTLSAASNGNLTAKPNGLGAEVAALNSNKVNVSDIVNNLTSTVTDKPLSAAQGKALNDKFTNRFDSVYMHSLPNANDYTVLEITKSSYGDQIFFILGIGAGGTGSIAVTNGTGTTIKNATDNTITVVSNTDTTLKYTMPSKWYRIIVLSNSDFSIRWVAS